MIHHQIVDVALLFIGWGIRHFWPTKYLPIQKYPFSRLPVISEGQDVTGIFLHQGKVESHRRLPAIEVKDTITINNLKYDFDRVDERGRFIYQLKA